MAWSRLDCWTTHQNWVLIKTDTDIAFLGKYEIFAFVKAEHIWTFDIQSWNMKPIGIGIQQWLHMGMVFLLERPRTAGQCAWILWLLLWNFGVLFTINPLNCRLINRNTACLSIPFFICNAFQNDFTFMLFKKEQYIQHIQNLSISNYVQKQVSSVHGK